MTTPQVDPLNPDWWTASPDNPDNESGTLKEIKDKRKVLLNVVYNVNEHGAPGERETIRLIVRHVIESYAGFEIVTYPEAADLAIVINASKIDEPTLGGQAGNFSAGLDASTQTPLAVTVVIRGTPLRNGTHRSRIIWELSSPNVRGDLGPAAAFAVDGLIRQVKRVRGEK